MVTYRRDRFGENWHLIPAGELGVRGRSLCGEPRQGTSLSETYAFAPRGAPDTLCARCLERKELPTLGSMAHV